MSRIAVDDVEPAVETTGSSTRTGRVGTGAPVVSVGPLTLESPARGVDLEVRVSAPVTGRDLPVVLFSHGFGSSSRAYGPLVDFWAAHGFVVVQPTHLDSRTVGLAPHDPRQPTLWRHRVEDMLRILDDLDRLEGAVPGLPGRVDHGSVAVAGHSFGGQTAGVLLGLRVTDPVDGTEIDLADGRVGAGVLLATAGRGGADLRPGVIEAMPWLNPVFAHLRTPCLVVAGDADVSPLTTRGADWLTDPYRYSPGARSLLTLVGGEHSLGGIPGYEAAETTDEDPERVAVVQRTTWAFLRSTLRPGDPAWAEAVAALADPPHPSAVLESKRANPGGREHDAVRVGP
ncbi:chlorophyllase/cutinase-like alpha/beta fold protein [Actinomycetospora sp. TBRC 11914]|uniref:alpha/beta hydrolase family protein n=1 Tax=Actinomycetospora sp. TBRC 11914 TaxID=2729387 RepID=UPI00145F4E06|nr:chlorophyllase [Actinomycetospora sp. TBRC 11914]NMO91501.1 chlorophyllase [Actinomycetospora sp. TBRC 11914]